MKPVRPFLIVSVVLFGTTFGMRVGHAQSSLLVPADDPAYRHLVSLLVRGARGPESTAPDVLPWTNGDMLELVRQARLHGGDDADLLDRLARELERAAGPVVRGGDDDESGNAAVVGVRLRAGLRAASQERLDLIRLQADPEPGVYPFIALETFLSTGPWTADLAARHDVFYDRDPDGLDTALRLMARMENAYLRYDGQYIDATLGRLARHWGLFSRPGLVLSGNPRPMDQFSFRLGPDRLHIRSVLAELDAVTADGRFTGRAGDDSVTVGSERRFLAAHHVRIAASERWTVRLTHATLYSGAGSGISLKYLNPMNLSVLATDNLPKNDENNGFVAASVLFTGDGIVLGAEAALDDIQLGAGDEPLSLSATGYLHAANVVPAVDVTGGFTLVTSRAYNAAQAEGKYLYLGRGIATQWSDFVHADLEIRWLRFLGSRGLVFAPRLDVILQGAADMRLPFPDKDDTRTILADPVVRTIRPAIRFEAGVGGRVTILGEAGMNITHTDDIPPADPTSASLVPIESGRTFTGGIHVFVRLSDAHGL